MKDTTIARLEKKYNCRIRENHLEGIFKVYSLDGCPWDWCSTYRGLQNMLKEDQEALKAIAEDVRESRKAR